MKKVIRIAHLVVAYIVLVIVSIYALFTMLVKCLFETIELIFNEFKYFNEECNEISRNV